MNLPAKQIETLSELEKPIAKAMQGVKIRTLDPSQLREAIAENIKRAIKLTGLKDINAEDVKADINLLVPLVRRNHGGITVDELRYITEQGSIGKFGKFYGVNPKTLIEWIEGYKTSPERKQTLQTIKRLSEYDKPQIEAAATDFKEFWEQAKADYQKTGRILGAVYLYENARRHKMIKLSLDQIETCKANARINAANRIHDQKQIDIFKGRHLADKYRDEQSEAFRNLCKIEAIKLMFTNNKNHE